jgi:hypothetical protein
MRTFRNIAAVATLFAASAFALDEGMLRLAMPDARVLSGISIAQARTSPLGQFLLSQVNPNDQSFQQMMAATGFDPRRDLQEILVATPGKPGAQRSLVLARGTFDGARILAMARTAGAEVTPYNGVDILNGGGKGPHPMSVAFLDHSLAIAGDAQSVREAIDRRNQPTGIDPNLARKAAALSAGNDAWFISAVPLAELAGRVPDPNVSGMLKGDSLQAIEQTSGGVKFGAAVQLSAEVIARTAEDATSLAGVFRFLAGLAQMGQRNNPQAGQVASLLSGLDLRTEGNAVKLALALPEAQVENLIAQAQQHHRAPTRPQQKPPAQAQ